MDLDDRMQQARAAGATWDQIHASINQRIQTAKAAGATDDQIDTALGYRSGDGLMSRMRAQAQANLQAQPPTLDPNDVFGSFVQGLQSSSGGLISRSRLPDANMNPNPGFAARIANMAGVAVGDIPAMIQGGIMGGRVGALVPGAGETGESEAIGAGAGAFALPQAIKSEYLTALNNGEVRNADDFIERQMGVLWDTTKAGVIGALTGGTGKLAENAAVAQGARPVTTFMTKSAAELATMTTAGAAMQGKLPTREDFIDGAVLLAAFHVAGATAVKASDLRSALQRHWQETDEPPIQAAQRAATDPVFRAQLFGVPKPLSTEVRGASATPVAPPERFAQPDMRRTADLVLQDRVATQPGVNTGGDDRFVLPRANAGLDHVTGIMRTIEGGTVGGDLSRPRISPAGAVGENQIMPATGRQYGLKGSDAEVTAQLKDPEINRLIQGRIMTDLYNRFHGDEEAMLAAYNAGPGRGAQLQRQGPGTRLRSEIDPHTGKHVYTVEPSDRNEAFLPMETQRYLADARRVAQGKGGQLSGSGVMNHTDIPRAEDEGEFAAAMASYRSQAETEEGQQPEKPQSLWSRFLADESGSLDPWEAVGSRMADADKAPSILERLSDAWHNTYLELFQPGHPIRQLSDAAASGRALTGATDPEWLYRFAELSETRSKYMVERGMIDPDGRITGPSLNDIIDLGNSGPQGRRFWTYAISKWAVEKLGQSKETGVEADAARRVVEEGEAGGFVPPGEDTLGQLARVKGRMEKLPDTNRLMRVIGPHFDIRANVVRMPDLSDAELEARYGKGMTFDRIRDHEIGHAIAYNLGRLFGDGTWAKLDPRAVVDLTDELQIVSRRYKPGMWRDQMNRAHFTKNQELIADAIATWMTDPIARTRMPEFEALIAKEAPGFDLEGTLGAKPGEYGTPMQRAFQQLQDWQNGTFRYLYKSGLISREVYLQSIAENASRIPGYRELDQPPSGMGTGPGKTGWNPVKEFLGSDKKIENILQSLLQEAFLRVQLADYNNANRAIFEAAEQLGPSDPMGAVKVEVARRYDLLGAINDIRGAGVSDENIQTILQHLGGDRVRRDEVPIFENGRMMRIKFNDPDMVRLLRGYDNTSMATWQKIVASLTKVQRAAIVLNPLFPIRLAMYDVPWQFITKPGFRNTLSDFVVGMRHVIGNTEAYDGWLRSGGAERVFDGLSKNDYIRKVLKGEEDPSFTDGVWNVVKTPYEALRTWGQAIGQAERAGRFIRGQQQGETPDKSAVASSEAAFHRAGFGGPHTKSINAVIPFFAAYLNSLEQTVRGQFGIGRTITGEKFNPVQFTAKAAAIITLPVLAQWWHDHDKEWYKAAPTWQKDNGIFIHIGPDDGTGHTIFLKYPPLISLLYGGIPRRLAEAFIADNPHAFDEMGKSMGASLAPPGGLVLYNVFLPLIEHVANHSFFRDQPLVNDDTRKGVQPAEQYNQYSSGLARDLARFTSDVPLVKDMKLSPPVIDNYINDWGGTLGQAAVRATDMLTHAGPHAPGAPASHFEDWPLASSWMSRYPSASAEPIKTFYGRMDDFNAVHGSLVRAMEAKDLERFTQIAQANPTAAVVHAFNLRGKPIPADRAPYLRVLHDAAAQADMPSARLILQANQAMKQAREYAARVAGAENLTPNDKRQILDATYAQMQVMAERANDVMDRSHFDGYSAGRNTQPNPDSLRFQPAGPRM